MTAAAELQHNGAVGSYQIILFLSTILTKGSHTRPPRETQQSLPCKGPGSVHILDCWSPAEARFTASSHSPRRLCRRHFIDSNALPLRAAECELLETRGLNLCPTATLTEELFCPIFKSGNGAGGRRIKLNGKPQTKKWPLYKKSKFHVYPKWRRKAPALCCPPPLKGSLITLPQSSFPGPERLSNQHEVTAIVKL